MRLKTSVSVDNDKVSVTTEDKYCVDDDSLFAAATVTGVAYVGTTLVGFPAAAAVGGMVATQMVAADESGELSLTTGDYSSKLDVSLSNLSIKNGEICNMNKETNTETCVSMSREDGILTEQIPYAGQTCVTLKVTKTEELNTDNKKTEAPLVKSGEYCPINNSLSETQNSNELNNNIDTTDTSVSTESNSNIHKTEQESINRSNRLVFYQAVENIVGFADILKNKHNMSSSEFDRAVSARAVSIISILKNMHGSEALISHFILDGKLHSADIIKFVISNIRSFLPDIPIPMVEVIKDMLSHHHLETIAKHLILYYMEMINPIVGELKVLYSIAVACWHLFDRVRIVNVSVEGTELPVAVRSTVHASFSKGIYTVYWGEIKDPMFNIDVHTTNYNNKNDAAKGAGQSYLEQLKENAYACTGLPYEMFCPDISKSPKGMFETYKDLHFRNKLLAMWMKKEGLSAEERFLYEDYLNGGEKKSWWDKHRHENPIQYILNWLKYHNLHSYSDEGFRKLVIDANKKRPGSLDDEHKMDEKKERGDKDNNRGDYTRVNTTLYANLVLFLNDISIGNLYDTEVGALRSVMSSSIVYFDKEVDELLENVYNYMNKKIKRFLSTYKQIWLTNTISSHLTTSLCILIPAADNIKGTALSFVSANMSMLTSLVISSFHVSNKNISNKEYVFNIITNTVQVNIGYIAEFISKSLFKVTGIISKFQGFIPGLIVLGTIRLIKNYAIDIEKEVNMRIKKTINILNREIIRNRNIIANRIKTANAILNNSYMCDPYREYHAKEILKEANINRNFIYDEHNFIYD